MKYCSLCGADVSLSIPEGDNLPRHVCTQCGEIHYQNPKMVVGCIPEYEDKILLCKRAIEPRRGFWTLPAGFMENAETTAEAAMRETHEEANAEVEIINLFSMFSLPHINQVYILFRARLCSLDFGPGTESLDVRLYEEKDIPWDNMAFPVITESLRRYFADRLSGRFNIHSGDMFRQPGPRPAFIVSDLTGNE